jgi:hypothetical protein
MESRFVEAIEGATGRTVRAFLSQTHIAPDISCEVFVLERTGGEPAADSERYLAGRRRLDAHRSALDAHRPASAERADTLEREALQPFRYM